MRRTLHIEYNWWRPDGQPIAEDDEERLDEDALFHIQAMRLNGFEAGELLSSAVTDDGAQVEFRGWWMSAFKVVEDDDSRPILRCTWCCRDTATIPCEHCDNDATISDRTKPHRPEWSRATVREVECKVCDRRGPYDIQRSSAWCDASNSPNIKGLHEPAEG